MIKKVILTGGLVIIAKGSSAQILLGQVVCALYLILCIRTLPYVDDTDDLLQSLASTAMLLNMMVAFALKTNNTDDPEYDEYTWGILLIIVNMIIMILGVSGMLILGCPCILRNCRKLGCMHGQMRKLQRRLSKKAVDQKTNSGDTSEEKEGAESAEGSSQDKKKKKKQKSTKVAPTDKAKTTVTRKGTGLAGSRGGRGRGRGTRGRGRSPGRGGGRAVRGRAALRGRAASRGGKGNGPGKKKSGRSSMGSNGWGGSAASPRVKKKSPGRKAAKKKGHNANAKRRATSR